MIAGKEDSREAWRRLLAMMKARAKRFPRGGSTVRFDREEVYAERLDRVGRISG
jgi:hypothetical protein